LKDWESISRSYFKDLSAGLEWLIIAPLNEEERIQKFQLKQRLFIPEFHVNKKTISIFPNWQRIKEILYIV